MPINPKYEESIRETIVMMYQGGISVKSIVEEIEGVNAHDVRKVLREHGVLSGPGRRPTIVEEMDESTMEAMLTDYYNDMPMYELVDKYNLGRIDRVYMILRELGQTPRSYIPERMISKKAALDRAMELYAQGMPLWQIEEETGINSTRISDERHRRKLPGRRLVTYR